MPVFDFDGMAIAYDHAGTGDPVLFLHNLGGDRSIWAAQYQAMQATHSVYALDWFGYGDSDIPDNGYSIENYQRLLGDFIQAHGLRNVTLVGHCFGSAMALLYAKRHPEMVQALVLSSPLTAATLRPTLTGWTARIARHMRLDAIAAGLRLPALVAGWLVREQLGPFSRGIDSNAFLKLKNRWSEPRRLLPVAAVARDLPGLAELDSFRPPETFPPITTIWGEENRILSPNAGMQLNVSLKPQRMVTLPDCGHLLMLEAPDTVTNAIYSALPSR